MIFTEDMLERFSQPLSTTEDEQCKNAIRMVIDALKPLGLSEKKTAVEPMYYETYSYYQVLESANSDRKIKVFLQGSYANNTNVRTQSDVDIAIVQEERFQTEYRTGVLRENYNFTSAKPREKTFKDEVLDALRERFGNDVERANKSIKVNGNTYRKDADGVPCIRHRDYRNDYLNDPDNFVGGIMITADDGEKIINYPEQHIKNGKEKNVETSHYYKKMVRIIKNMRYIMKENKIAAASHVSSFALESLMWNVPNSVFLDYRYNRKVYMFDRIVHYLNTNTYFFSEYKEANGIKPLCPTWEQEQKMRNFITALKEFYQYD